MNDETIAQTLINIDRRLARIENNQKIMIVTRSEHSDAYREQQTQLQNHEGRIDKLERGNQDPYEELQLK